MPPEHRQEIITIVEMLIKRALDGQDEFRRELNDISKRNSILDQRINAVIEERLNGMEEDVKKLEKKIDQAIEAVKDVKGDVTNVKNEIIVSQEAKYKSTINRQNAILAAIGVAALAYLVPLILQLVFHH